MKAIRKYAAFFIAALLLMATVLSSCNKPDNTTEAPKESTPFPAYLSGAQAEPPKASAIFSASIAPLSEKAAACSFMPAAQPF